MPEQGADKVISYKPLWYFYFVYLRLYLFVIVSQVLLNDLHLE